RERNRDEEEAGGESPTALAAELGSEADGDPAQRSRRPTADLDAAAGEPLLQAVDIGKQRHLEEGKVAVERSALIYEAGRVEIPALVVVEAAVAYEEEQHRRVSEQRGREERGRGYAVLRLDRLSGRGRADAVASRRRGLCGHSGS